MGLGASMLKTLAVVLLMTLGAPGWTAVPYASHHVLVVDDVSGEVLLEKYSQVAAPIASQTKLMTAMVVLDARQDPDERVRIDEADRDTIKHTRHGVPIGAVGREAVIGGCNLSGETNAASRCMNSVNLSTAVDRMRTSGKPGLARV
jgi:serine-type D-Ala-D-Ala endopeptidase (penicillin-binding protein 7)